MPDRNKGFTLLELSIVLTVIAFIIGAIVVGSTMLKNARLQAAVSDMDVYMKAFASFKDKYNYLPGDFPNAESFWGSLAGCPAPAYTALHSQATCNGDGNGHIGDHWLGAGNGELFTAWQQLADAGFIGASFNGISGTGSAYEAKPGTNVPTSVFQNAGYTIMYVQPQTFGGDPNYFPAQYNHVIIFGAQSAGDFTEHAIILPGDAQMIDTKMDDGLPASGMVMAAKSALLPNCTTSDTPSASKYNDTYASTACSLFFITGF